MEKGKFLLLTCLIVLLISSCGCIEDNKENSSIKSKIIYVDDDGKGEYTRIQDAIDNASDGYTIYVYNGTYFETFVINKSITLIGASIHNTILECNEGKTSQITVIEINADNCTINGFKIIKSTGSKTVTGIKVNSANNTITNNTILDASWGVYIKASGKNNSVFLNNISNNHRGIVVENSYNNNISKNNISSCLLQGIFLSDMSNNNIIYGNILSNNDHGIRIKNSMNNKVYSNTIINNRRGVYCCCGAQNNIIYKNLFKQNEEWNAHDDTSNHWDNGIVGNYWDDYTGIDNDEDGIGDSVYYILNWDNQKNNEDRYPLMNPIVT